MKSFASDNYAPVHPEVLEEIAKVNIDHMKAYGADQITEKAIDLIKNFWKQKMLRLTLFLTELEQTSLDYKL